MSKLKSPQDKKRASLKRDRRNTFGDSPHGSRKNIPRSKAKQHQQERRTANQALSMATDALDPDQFESIEDQVKSRIRLKRLGGFKKHPDQPLGEVIKRKRELRTGNKGRLTQSQSQNCVLCLGPADFVWADGGTRKHFFCLRCMEYQITVTAEKRLAASPAEWRKPFSDKAKSLKGDPVLVITVPSGPRSEGTAYAALRGELIPSANLPPPD